MDFQAGDRVSVGAAPGTVVYTERIGCCGGINVAIKLDGSGQIHYARPGEVTLLEQR